MTEPDHSPIYWTGNRCAPENIKASLFPLMAIEEHTGRQHLSLKCCKFTVHN